MLNIKFTLSSGGGVGRDIWHMTESHCFHSQELPLLGLACYECIIRSTRIDKLSLQQYRACVVDSLRLGITCLTSLCYVYKASRSCLC